MWVSILFYDFVDKNELLFKLLRTNNGNTNNNNSYLLF